MCIRLLGLIIVSHLVSTYVGTLHLTGLLRGRLYLVDLNKSKVSPKTCLVAKSSMGWLWYHRLAYVGMRNLAKLLKNEHILGLTNVHFEKDRICKACQARKQVGAPHPLSDGEV
jgi:hypothetical protein